MAAEVRPTIIESPPLVVQNASHALSVCGSAECGRAPSMKCIFCATALCPAHGNRVRPLAKTGSVVSGVSCSVCCPQESCWAPDSTAKQCFECSRSFNFFRRRHHCRVCGQIFCDRCSGFRRTLKARYPSECTVTVRVCLPCLEGPIDPSCRTETPSILSDRQSAQCARFEEALSGNKSLTYSSSGRNYLVTEPLRSDDIDSNGMACFLRPRSTYDVDHHQKQPE